MCRQSALVFPFPRVLEKLSRTFSPRKKSAAFTSGNEKSAGAADASNERRC